VYEDGCLVPLLVTDSPPCLYGRVTGDTTIVLFGDSHAAQWFPAVDSVARVRGWRLVDLTKSGCPSVSIALVNPRLGRRYFECEAWRTRAVDRIVELRPAMVVITNARSYSVLVGNDQPHTDSSAVARREWTSGLSRTLAALAPSGARLVVLEDTPQPRYDVPRCLARFVRHPDRCAALDVRRALSPDAAASEQAAVRESPGTAYISMNRVICDTAECPMFADGLIRYLDNSHLAVRYAASLAPQLSEQLTQALVTTRTRTGLERRR
jgi:hypothetical protein